MTGSNFVSNVRTVNSFYQLSVRTLFYIFLLCVWNVRTVSGMGLGVGTEVATILSGTFLGGTFFGGTFSAPDNIPTIINLGVGKGYIK